MGNARQWVVPPAVGLAAGLGLGAYWTWAERMSRPCEEHICWFPVYPFGWTAGAMLLLAGSGLLLLFAGRRGLWAASVAAIGSLGVGLAIGAYDGFAYGTPRPPYPFLAAVGVASFLGAAATRVARPARLIGGSIVVALVAAVVAGDVTSPRRDRLHRFTELAAVSRLPDQSRWRVTSAEAYPRYRTIELHVAAISGGPTTVLLELPTPPTWQPPKSCGPNHNSLAIALFLGTEVRGGSCTAYPGGGWQRIHPSEVDLLDVQGELLVLASPESSDQPVQPAVQREMMQSLRPATPRQMADLSAT
ncbi:hypothetical protein ODJ79_38580 [Actinoplanes sp. KI2]|uniref:hypothetical protein n=1 Tax=Actinoplanes sp. KI2 TaxID=2983315 RepID=UPI0021D5F4C2|nr:hypothetical protein [Actinoplanes sp. KI2]MCU7729658.1 hypothetical protein [Actinoplanes sp. KI2]